MLSVAIVANPNSQFPIGNIDIDNWQHFHIGNIQQVLPHASRRNLVYYAVMFGAMHRRAIDTTGGNR